MEFKIVIDDLHHRIEKTDALMKTICISNRKNDLFHAKKDLSQIEKKSFKIKMIRIAKQSGFDPFKKRADRKRVVRLYRITFVCVAQKAMKSKEWRKKKAHTLCVQRCDEQE